MKKILTFLLLSFTFNLSHAWSITPMSSPIKPDQKTFSIKINNTGSKEMVAIKFDVMTRGQNIDAKEILTKTDDLKVFPKHVVVPAGGVSTVRVSVFKPNQTQYEKAYRLIAEAVPISTREGRKSGVNVLLKYMASIYLLPPVSQDVQLKVHSAKLINNALQLEVSNPGNRHKVMLVKNIIADLNGQEILLDNEDKLCNILSQSKVNMVVPLTNAEMTKLKASHSISLMNSCRDCSESSKITLQLD